MAETINFLQFIYSQERIEQVIALTQDAPVFLSTDHVRQRVLPELCLGTVGMFLLFAFFLQVLGNVKDRQQRHKLAYRFTNIVVTAVLGVIGIYGELYVLPNLPPDNVTTYIQGLEDHILIVNLMFSFQTWAMVTGSLFVQEDLLMMGHHLAVFLVCIMYSSFTNGFRYHMYYFAGIWEISSIPLALMNILRDHPKWKDRFPGLFFAIKTSFAFSFLILRIWIGTWRAVRYVTDLFVVFTTTLDKPILYQAFMFLMFAMSFFLFVLQFYWAWLIIVMIVRNARVILKQLFKKLKVT